MKRSEAARTAACFGTERLGDRKNTLTASMFSVDLIGRASPLLRFCTESVSLNGVTHRRIDLQHNIEAISEVALR